MELGRVWDEPEMRDALARRDMGAVYRLLRRVGMSQRDIAARTGQSQSEISEIQGGRQVMAYDVLERIATGLGIPRGYLGLAYSYDDRGDPLATQSESLKRRWFLAHAGQVVMGAAVFGPPGESFDIEQDTPVPRQIALADVRQVTKVTTDLHELELLHGGGVALPAIMAQVRLAERLLTSEAEASVLRAMQGAVAWMHRLAACAAFDMDLVDNARRHLLRAMELARQAELPIVQAALLCNAGRIELHQGPADGALRLFQLGYASALACGSPRVMAVLEANEARAYGELGEHDRARAALKSAREHFAADEKVEYTDFYNPAELHSAEGVTWVSLGDDPRAIAALNITLRHRPQGAVLDRSFDLADLSAAHLRTGDVANGITIGHQAVDLMEVLHSKRIRDRLDPLRDALARTGRAGRSLMRRISQVPAIA